MTFEDIDTTEEEFESLPPEESNNRTFIIVASALGGLMLLTLICTALYAFFLLPRSRQQREAEVATVNAQNTAMAVAVTQTSRAARWSPTSPPVEPTATSEPTNTPVLAQPATSTSTPIIDAVATTQAALFTLAAEVTQTTILTSTALPSSGFADDVGAPSLLALAVVLVVVIFLVRRLRTVG
jgi:hypothetical protein